MYTVTDYSDFNSDVLSLDFESGIEDFYFEDEVVISLLDEEVDNLLNDCY